MKKKRLLDSFALLAYLKKEDNYEKVVSLLSSELPSLPIRSISNTFENVLESARIKAVYSLSYADCFAVATAKREDVPIITGDPEFRKVEKIVKIEWV